LAAGQIAFQGLTSTAPTKQLAVTGGTGRYKGVGGEATLVEVGDQTGSLTVRLRGQGSPTARPGPPQPPARRGPGARRAYLVRPTIRLMVAARITAPNR
jgi:hypothetical protein